MNLGQFFSTYSPLPAGTVAQHLQALQIGNGGATVFASQFLVSIQEPTTTTAALKPKSVAKADAEQTRVMATIESNEMYVLVGSQQQLAVRKFDQKQYATKAQLSA